MCVCVCVRERVQRRESTRRRDREKEIVEMYLALITKPKHVEHVSSIM